MTSATPAPDPSARPWRILCGLTISGFLLALPGGILPLWGYHIRSEFGSAANYFLLVGIGLALGAWLPLRARAKFSGTKLLSAGCCTGSLALVLVAFGAPPAPFWFQSLALLTTGIAAGAINTAVFQSIATLYEQNRARATLTAGIFFGLGSVLSAYLLAECVDAASPLRILTVAAIAPATVGILLGRGSFPVASVTRVTISQTAKDLRSPLAVMFALLLFFQFGNEWSIAGWLPVFLIDRLGISPSSAVVLLAVYWLAVSGGRVITARLLPVVSHGKLLGMSAFCALFGCTALLAAGTRFGTVVGILLTGIGFSAIYPLAAERIAGRFSGYHPGYFNGIFTFALMGGILGPFILGHAAAEWGLRVVPLAAICGSCAVFALILLIWLGHKVSGT